MRFPSYWKNLLVTMVTVCIVVSLFPLQPSFAFSDQIIQRGATGDDVIELQARLQYNGYYHGRIDGVFGWSTYWSVRNFQKEFRLEEVDGLVGGKTKEMLSKATKYYKEFVYQQLNQRRQFTHYGGMSLDKQSAPSPQIIEQARKAAEIKRSAQLTERLKAVEKSGKPNQQAQQPNGQPQNKKQAPFKLQGEQPIEPNQPAKQQMNSPEQKQPAKQQANSPEQKQPAKQQTNSPEQKQPEEEKGNQPVKQQEQKEAAKESAVNMPNGFSQNDLRLMANAVYGEARGEPFIGQVAVAAVILNRINSPTFPNTASGVIYEPGAFTAVADGQINLTPNEQAKKAVLDAINGFDPTESATYYFNPDTATNKWIWGRPQIKRIGKHIFCN